MSQSLQRLRILYISFFLLTGCLHTQLHEAPLTLEETSWPDHLQTGGRSISSKEWWLQYEDPQLNQWVCWALESNPGLAEARDRIRTAYAQAEAIHARLVPHLDLFGSYSRQRQSLYDVGIPAFVPLVINQNPWFNTATVLLEGSYELDIWGKNRAAYRAGLSTWQQHIADQEQTKLILVTTLVSTYLDWQSKLLQLECLGEAIAVQKQRIHLIHSRFKQQIRDLSPTLEIERELRNLEIQQAELQGSIEMDEHALMALVGRPLSLESPSAQWRVQEDLPDTLPLNFICHRPDLVSSLWSIQSQTFEVVVAKTQFYPNLNLTANLGQISFLVSRFFEQPATSLLGLASSVLPIYRGGELRAQYAEAQAMLDQTISQYNTTLLQSIEEVSDSLSSWKSTKLSWEAHTKNLDDVEQLYSLAEARWQNQIRDLESVLSVKKQWYDQKIITLQAALDVAAAQIQFVKALGGGYDGS